MKHARPMPPEYVIIKLPSEGDMQALFAQTEESIGGGLGIPAKLLEQPVTGPEEQPHSRPEEAPQGPSERLEQPTRGPRETA